MSTDDDEPPEIGVKPLVVLRSSNLVYSLWRTITSTSIKPDCALPRFSTTMFMFNSTPTTPSVTYNISGLLKPGMG